MVVKARQRVTVDELAKMSDGDRYELVHGILVEREMSPLSAFIAGEIYSHLREYSKKHTEFLAFPDSVGYTLYEDETELVRKPDASVIKRSRLPDGKIPSTRFPFSPDIAVEVISPSDTVFDVENKTQEYLDAGTTLVWVVNPNKKQVKVYQADGSEHSIGITGTLTAEPILLGFELPVSAKFEASK